MRSRCAHVVSRCFKTLLAHCALLTLQVRALFKLEFRIFPLITYFRYHVTEHCAVVGTYSTCGATSCSMAISQTLSLGAE